MDKEQLTRFTAEQKEHLEMITSFMLNHNLNEISLHETDDIDNHVRVDLVFTE